MPLFLLDDLLNRIDYSIHIFLSCYSDLKLDRLIWLLTMCRLLIDLIDVAHLPFLMVSSKIHLQKSLF